MRISRAVICLIALMMIYGSRQPEASLLCATDTPQSMDTQPAATIDQERLRECLLEGSPSDFILIDIRRAEEIISLIGTDQCRPYNLQWPGAFQAAAEKLPKDGDIVIYCMGGGRSAAAVAYLRGLGYTRVHDAGGIRTWTGPVIHPSQLRSALHLPEPSCDRRRAALVQASY